MVRSHADKIVLFGMSCSGKTTFAKTLTEHRYYCFDALFDWGSIETLGLSPSSVLESIGGSMPDQPYVLDGWHLSDPRGLLLPPRSVVYVIYASYDRIIGQYRRPVEEFDEHLHMFKKWYSLEYDQFPDVRFYENTGEFHERTQAEFESFVDLTSR